MGVAQVVQGRDSQVQPLRQTESHVGLQDGQRRIALIPLCIQVEGIHVGQVFIRISFPGKDAQVRCEEGKVAYRPQIEARLAFQAVGRTPGRALRMENA